MKKQIFFPYWFHFLAAVIFSLICIALLVLEILLPIEDGSTLYWGLPLTVIITIFMIIAMGYNNKRRYQSKVFMVYDKNIKMAGRKGSTV